MFIFLFRHSEKSIRINSLHILAVIKDKLIASKEQVANYTKSVKSKKLFLFPTKQMTRYLMDCCNWFLTAQNRYQFIYILPPACSLLTDTKCFTFHQHNTFLHLLLLSLLPIHYPLPSIWWCGLIYLYSNY